MFCSKFSRGFTLAELLVVITILAILSAIGYSVYSGIQKQARDATRKGDLDSIAAAYEDGYNLALGTYSTVSGSQFTSGTIPTGPSGTTYTYVDGPNAATLNSNAYKVCTVLENGQPYCRTNQQGNPSNVAFIPPVPPLPAQTPVQTGISGTKWGPVGWNSYSMGFRFTPTVNGQITKLWSYTTSGTTRTVKLYTDAGTLITSASITGNGAWASANITPVSVTAGTYYKVVVYPSSNAFYISPVSPTFPATIGNITIPYSIYIFGDAANPANPVTATLYGLVDITFQP